MFTAAGLTAYTQEPVFKAAATEVVCELSLDILG